MSGVHVPVSLKALDHDDHQFDDLLLLLRGALEDEDWPLSERLRATLEREMRNHFVREEQLFSRVGYRKRDHHREGHALMMRALARLKRDVKAQNGTAAKRMAQDVTALFEGRLHDDDRAFAAFLSSTA